MNLTLDQNEVQFILNVLGDLPAKTGVWPLIVKIKEQAEVAVAQQVHNQVPPPITTPILPCSSFAVGSAV